MQLVGEQERLKVAPTHSSTSRPKGYRGIRMVRGKLFSDFYEALPAGILGVNREGRVVYPNRGAAKTFGCRVHEPVGQSAFAPVHPDDRANARFLAGQWGAFVPTVSRLPQPA